MLFLCGVYTNEEEEEEEEEEDFIKGTEDTSKRGPPQNAQSFCLGFRNFFELFRVLERVGVSFFSFLSHLCSRLQSLSNTEKETKPLCNKCALCLSLSLSFVRDDADFFTTRASSSSSSSSSSFRRMK